MRLHDGQGSWGEFETSVGSRGHSSGSPGLMRTKLKQIQAKLVEGRDLVPARPVPVLSSFAMESATVHRRTPATSWIAAAFEKQVFHVLYLIVLLPG
jgi:hypothetical protein